MNARIEQLIQNHIEGATSLASIVKLHGDASYRAYYRAQLSDGKSFIVMQMPEGKSSASEEITNYHGTHRELPFINVQRYLSQLSIPVPCVYAYDDDLRLMLLEDLGDQLMARQVEHATIEDRALWYERAVDLLIRMQQRAQEHPSSDCVANARSFDARLLNWEFDHFREYGVEAKLGITMTDADRATFERETRAITAAIEKMPYGFTHRDFQSRNLIVRNNVLHLLDFQDALRGPSVYDLVALTRDSYVRLDEATIDRLIARFATAVRRPALDIRREYDLVTVQRKLKDAGRFVYIDRVKHNPNFLQYFPTSVGYVREALARLPEHAALTTLLLRFIPEWQ